MAKKSTDDLSAAATAKVATSDPETATVKGSTKSASDELLVWVARKFRFDPNNRRTPQPAVRDLQEQLSSYGVSIKPDGILGKQTIDAIIRLGPSLRPTEADPKAGSATQQAPNDERLDNAVEDAAASKAEHFEDIEEDEPDTTPEPGDEGSDPELHGDEEEIATARPVALSDSAIDDISQDRLGFTPYVEAVAEFILAQQTRPPLALAINARWGQGKTSFMNMLDGQLEAKARESTVRVATTWFNPWKYSEPEQVWAAFVANVTRCVRANLTRGQYWRFKWNRFVDKMKRHADFPLILRLLVAFIFVLLVLSLPFTLDLPAFHTTFKDKGGLLGGFYAATEQLSGWLWWLLFIPFALLSVLYGYITFTKGLGLNLLEYVEKTDFKDKIGTLSQFESEMRRLADAVPEDLKVVVFIDDLDRCKGKVLGEIIEALQLADVSRSCIFIMGMDMRIVATAIETEREELAHSAESATSEMEHGSGYKFLEKIIQARLSLPTHRQAEMAALVASAMRPDPEPAKLGAEFLRDLVDTVVEDAVHAITGAAPKTTLNKVSSAAVNNRVTRAILTKTATIRTPSESAEPGGDSEAEQARREMPSDSPLLVELAEHYGGRHFTNPRRLKRFINSFRLHAYLADAVQPKTTEVDHLARFLVLAEKWPALLHHLVEENKGADILDEPTANGTSLTMAGEIARLRENDHARIVELLRGRFQNDPLTPAQIQSLAAWTGFSYYPGLEAKKDSA